MRATANVCPPPGRGARRKEIRPLHCAPLVCGHTFEAEIMTRPGDVLWCVRCREYRLRA